MRRSPQTPRSIDESKALAKEHRSRWLSGERPSIEALLAEQGAASATDDLLLRLVLAEVAARLSIGEAPSAAEYIQRFPDRKGKIEKLLADKQAELDKLRRATHETEPLWRNESERSPATSTAGAAAPELAAAPSSHPGARPPKRLGRYDLLELLGRGGFGAVYRAYDPQLDRDVALKVPRAGTVDDAEQLHRFLREARAAGGLRHPHIVPIYEAGQADEQAYISSGLIVGQTMHAWLKERGRKLPPREAAGVIAKLARALAYAHEQGVVHRDIKPHNVMIDAQGEPVLMDFGLARRDTGESQRTMEGTRMGTPAYMSPEQAGGQSHLADGRSDQWSLGVMLYELLAGQLPFQREGLAIFVSICKDEPPALQSLDPTLPRDLQTIVQKCLNKSPADRYANCDALADDLERFRRGDAVMVRPQRWSERYVRWAKRNPAVAGLSSITALLAVAIILGLGIFSYQIQSQNTELDRQTVQLADALSDVEAQTEASELAARNERAALARQVEKADHLRKALDDVRAAAERRDLAESERKNAEASLVSQQATTAELAKATESLEQARQAAKQQLAEKKSEQADLSQKSKAISRYSETGNNMLAVINLIKGDRWSEAMSSLAAVPAAERKLEWRIVTTFAKSGATAPRKTINVGSCWAFDDDESLVAVARFDQEQSKSYVDLWRLSQDPPVCNTVLLPKPNLPLGLFWRQKRFVVFFDSSLCEVESSGTVSKAYSLPQEICVEKSATRDVLDVPLLPPGWSSFFKPGIVDFWQPENRLAASPSQLPVWIKKGYDWMRKEDDWTYKGGCWTNKTTKQKAYLYDQQKPRAGETCESYFETYKFTRIGFSKLDVAIRSTLGSRTTQKAFSNLDLSHNQVALCGDTAIYAIDQVLYASSLIDQRPISDITPYLSELGKQRFCGLVDDGTRCVTNTVEEPALIVTLTGDIAVKFADLGEDFLGQVLISPKAKWLVIHPPGAREELRLLRLAD